MARRTVPAPARPTRVDDGPPPTRSGNPAASADTVDGAAMARTVKQARLALIESVRRSLHGDGGDALRAAHAQVFEHLDADGTRLTTLADRARMSHQAMGELVDELIRHGLLERIRDPADGRARLLRPTARGRAQLNRAAAVLSQLYDRWERELDGITVAQVVGALDILIDICSGPDGSTKR